MCQGVRKSQGVTMRGSNVRRLVACATLLLASEAWSLDSARRRLTEITGNVPLVVDASVPPDQVEAIQGDLKVLEALNYSHDSELAELMGVVDTSSAGLTSFLKDRVRYIVGEFYSTERNLGPSQDYLRYPNPGVLPDLDTKPSFDSGILMSNLGSALYMSGKQNHVGLSFRLSDGRVVDIVSPRTGLVQIGAALFDPRYRPNMLQPKAQSNSIFRLQTYFHEARHSDGNGKSLGFPHALCPKGHDYENEFACDKTLNGPYIVESEIMRKTIPQCTECSVRETEILKIVLADNLNRLLKVSATGEVAKKWDPTPEFAQ
jgi:hypothetical protein